MSFSATFFWLKNGSADRYGLPDCGSVRRPHYTSDRHPAPTGVMPHSYAMDNT